MPLPDHFHRPTPENPGPEAVAYGIGGLVILAVAVALPYLTDQSVTELRPMVAAVGSAFTAASLAGWFIFRDK